MIGEKIYDYLEQEKFFTEEQRGCRLGSRGTKVQLLIDKTVLKDCKKKHTILYMTWIENNKVYYFVPHSWGHLELQIT